MKNTSSGVIIKYKERKFLLGHVTGNIFFDVFKGKVEGNETFEEAAIRECKEESNIDICLEEMKYLGKINYNKKKNLVLYLVERENINFEDLNCVTFFDKNKSKKEMDYYALFDFEQMLENTSKSMQKALLKLL